MYGFLKVLHILHNIKNVSLQQRRRQI